VVEIIRKFSKSCINLIYPPKCVVCNSSLPAEESNNEYLCSGCFGKIKFVIHPICEKCGRLSNSLICSKCNKKPKLFFNRAFHVAVYDGVFKELIHLFKYSKNDYLDRFLAGFLAETILKNQFLKESDFIVPVPLHWQEKWRRGYNQTELLACEVSKKTRMPVLSNRLVKHRKIFSQTMLSGKERLKNVKGAFKVKNSAILRNKKILLVDDVFTTGATVNECARQLQKAKVKQINIITLACSCEI
jgi:competence protein ComFC